LRIARAFLEASADCFKVLRFDGFVHFTSEKRPPTRAGWDMIVSPTDATRARWFASARRLHNLPLWAPYALATNLLISILLLGYGLSGN
jgi:hypothetical protein